MPVPRLHASLTLASLLSLAGCGVPFPYCQRSLDDHLRTHLTERFVAQPGAYKLTARAVFRIGDFELPLTLRVLRLAPSSVRVVAIDDLGGTVFHLTRSKGVTTVVRGAPMIADATLCGLAVDLETWLQTAPHPGDAPVRHSEGAGLLRRLDGVATLYWASTAEASIDRVALGEDGDLTSSFELWWDGAHPQRARIVNHRFGYEVDATVREWQAADLTLADFAPPVAER